MKKKTNLEQPLWKLIVLGLIIYYSFWFMWQVGVTILSILILNKLDLLIEK